MDITNTAVANMIIEMNSPMSIDQIVESLIKEWKSSEKLEAMKTADRYYRNRNDIFDKQHTYYDADGIERTASGLANNKISHPAVRDLVDQKVQYLLASDWSVQCEQEEWQKILSEFYSDEFRTALKRVAKDAINKGIGWLYVYPEKNILKFQRIASQDLIPIWEDQDHTRLGSVIRIYSIIQYVSDQEKVEIHVEYWSSEGVRKYKLIGGKLAFEEEGSHLKGSNGEELNWNNRIPFIPFKYNDDEMMLLDAIKSLVDDYDSKKSTTSDLLDDETNKFKVVKGYESQDPKTFVRNMNTYRAAFIAPDGDISELGSAPDVTGAIAYLDKTRQDIYDFGRGVDTNSSMGANASGDARQYLYAKLDLDCNDLEAGIVAGLTQLNWFIAHTNKGCEKYALAPVKYEFSRNKIINTGQALDNAIKMQGVSGISMETIVNSVPGIENPEEEIAKWKQEQEQGDGKL